MGRGNGTRAKRRNDNRQIFKFHWREEGLLLSILELINDQDRQNVAVGRRGA